LQLCDGLADQEPIRFEVPLGCRPATCAALWRIASSSRGLAQAYRPIVDDTFNNTDVGDIGRPLERVPDMVSADWLSVETSVSRWYAARWSG
jgi:hypothetical protein